MSKPEVRMKDAKIHDNRLHGTAINHPKLGTTEIRTSSIINQNKEGKISRIETKNTIYLVHENTSKDSNEDEVQKLDKLYNEGYLSKERYERLKQESYFQWS